MAECMAKIEQGAVALLSLVADDNSGFGGAARGNGMCQFRACAENAAPVLFKPDEEGGIVDEAIFRNFSIAGAEFAFGQGCKRARIRQNE